MGAFLDVLCALHDDPLSAPSGRSSGVLEALSHLAKQAEGHRLMSGPQAVYALSAFMAPLLEELELVGNSAVGSAAAGRLKAAEHLLELAGLLLWQLSAEEEAFAVEFSSQGGFIQLDHMLRTDRPSLKSLALKVIASFFHVLAVSSVVTRVYQNRAKPTRILLFCSGLFWSGAKMPETANHGFWHISARIMPEENQKLEPEDIQNVARIHSAAIHTRLSTLITADTD